MSERQPTLFIPHGGGPCFFMDWTMGPPDTWKKMGAWLASLPASIEPKPKALLVVSGHWEERVPTVTSAPSPKLLYDYSGFPPHTYQLTWPAPGSPALAERVRTLLSNAGIESNADGERGFDHGVFIPLKVAYPDANVPTVQLSLVRDLDPQRHLAIGRALSALRDEGVLIVGSGMSYHNMRAFMTLRAKDSSTKFDEWLAKTVEMETKDRDVALEGWARAPAARESHPREEHLLPLMVAAGAALDDRGRQIFRDEVIGAVVSAVRFG